MTSALATFQHTHPQWYQALVSDSVVRWRKPWTPERVERLAESVQWVNAVKDDETVPHARWKDHAETINRGLEAAWEALRTNHDKDLEALPEDTRYAISELVGGYPGLTLATFERTAKKIQRLPDHLRPVWTALYDDVATVAQPMQALKTKAVKRQPRDPATAPAFVPPPVTTAAEKRVHALLEEVLASSYDRLVAMLIKRNLACLDSYTKGWTAAQADPSLCQPKSRYEHDAPRYDEQWHFSARTFTQQKPPKLIAVDWQAVHLVRPALGSIGQEHTSLYGPKPDGVAILTDNAQKEALVIKNMFLHKNMGKIASIVEAKGVTSLTQARVLRNEVDLAGLQGSLHFAFSDGSSFTVNNAVVGVTNSHGTYFHRFPLTFHDVQMPDGSAMKQPSEERMNTVFVAAAQAVSAPSSRRRGP